MVIPVTVSQIISQEMLDRWAAVSVDYNPLHVDPDFAKDSQFGSTIAHATLTITYILEMLTRWLGNGWLRGGKLGGIKFIAPVLPGDTITAGGKVISKKVQNGKAILECEVWLQKQDGSKAIIGQANAEFLFSD